MEGKVQITVRMSQEKLDRWEALAKRRYGDNSQESLDKVTEDAFKWVMGRWDRGYYSFYDWFWSRVAFYCPFKNLRAIAYAKLVFERYLE